MEQRARAESKGQESKGRRAKSKEQRAKSTKGMQGTEQRAQGKIIRQK